MKIKREIEVDVCDVPGCASQEDCYSQCLSCGAAHCFEHSYPHREGAHPDPQRTPHGVRYEAGVWGGGSYDGYYCNSCDERLSRERTDGLHAAYQRIETLRARYQEQYELQKLEAAQAEAEVQKERGRRGLR